MKKRTSEQLVKIANYAIEHEKQKIYDYCIDELYSRAQKAIYKEYAKRPTPQCFKGWNHFKVCKLLAENTANKNIEVTSCHYEESTLFKKTFVIYW